MRLLATFSAYLWTCLKVIWIDSTFAGKDFIAQIAQDFGWKLEYLKRTDGNSAFYPTIARSPVRYTSLYEGRESLN